MKKVNQLVLTVVILTFANVAFAQLVFTAVQARNILSSPEKFVQTYKELNDPTGRITSFSSGTYIVIRLLEAVKDDQQFLRETYALYARYETNKNNYVDKNEFILKNSFIAPWAIHYMKSGDDSYFKRIFETSDSYHVKSDALKKIDDLAYVKEVINKYTQADSKDEGNPSSDFLSIRGKELYKEDPQFVDSLAESAKNMYIREAAISASSNISLLQKYAKITDIDQYSHKNDMKARYKAFCNSFYQEAAKKRLLQLSQEK